MRKLFYSIIALIVLSLQYRLMAQEVSPIDPTNTTISSQWVLDAAGEEQRHAIRAVFLISCRPDSSFGTGFLLRNGLIVTNAHVVGTCNERTLIAISPGNTHVTFSLIRKDTDRDLALLKPAEPLQGGLELSSDNTDPVPGTTVSTWGYPLVYNGISPLLSVGYVAGYREEHTTSQSVKRIIVNGAFNHGNSGGPLLEAHNSKVVGVVVATYHLFPPEVDTAIQAFIASPRGGMSSGMFTTTDATGHTKTLMDMQVVGMILQQFYQTTQVMIGEAISASELRTFVREQSKTFNVKDLDK